MNHHYLLLDLYLAILLRISMSNTAANNLCMYMYYSVLLYSIYSLLQIEPLHVRIYYSTTASTGARHTGVEIYMVWFKGNCSTVEWTRE